MHAWHLIYYIKFGLSCENNLICYVKFGLLCESSTAAFSHGKFNLIFIEKDNIVCAQLVSTIICLNLIAELEYT